MWHKLFWLWFIFTSFFSLMLMLEDASAANLLFSSLLAGLGIIKLGGERSERPMVSRKLLKRLSG